MSVLNRIDVFSKKKQSENTKLKPAIRRWLKSQEVPYEWNKNWGSGIGKSGRPDLEIIAKGKTHYFELKDEHGELSTVQKDVIRRYGELKETVYVVKNLDEFKKIWSIITGKVN